MRAWLIGLASIAAPVAAAPVSDPWIVVPVETGCIAETSFYSGAATTKLALGQDVDGTLVMVMQNIGWSTQEGKTYDVYLLIDDRLFEGKATGGAAGVLTFNLKPEVMTAITKGSRMVPALKIDANTEKLLEQMRLTGSSAAMTRVRHCVEGIASAKRREGRIPPDPFRP